MTVQGEQRRTYRVELSLRTVLVVLAGAAAVWLFLQLWPILMVIVVALMVVGMLNPAIARLERHGLRRSFAVAIVFVGFCLAVAAFGALTIPSFVAQVAEIVTRLPDTQARIAHRLEQHPLGAPLARLVLDARSTEVVLDAAKLALAFSSKLVEAAAYCVTALFLSLYFILDRDRLRGGVFSLLPRAYHVRLSRILLNLEIIVGGYLRGQIVTSLMMAVLTFGVLTVAGVPNAMALALFAGVADVLPYVGALLACSPCFFAALSARGTTTAVIVLAILGAYQELESRYVVPRVYGRVLRLPAAMVMIALLVGGKLLGVLGALLALPIAAAIRMIIEELRVELPGDEAGGSLVREKDARGERDFARRAAGHPAAEAAAIASEIVEARHDREASGDDSASPPSVAAPDPPTRP